MTRHHDHDHDDRPPGRRSALLLRSALLGIAAGSRASLGVAGPALSDGARGTVAGLRHAMVVTGVIGELTGDKLPSTGSRLVPPSPQGRAVSAALGGAVLARRAGRRVWLPAATAAAFSTVGTWGGAAWRAWAAQRGPDWRGAIAEDLVALACTTAACAGTARG